MIFFSRVAQETKQKNISAPNQKETMEEFLVIGLDAPTYTLS